jgi:hypothetical protein
MQSVPIAFSIACIFLHILWLKSSARGKFIRSLAAFFLGGILFSALVVLYLIIFSIYDAFWTSYIQQNLLIYSSHGLGGNLTQVTFLAKINIFLDMLVRVQDTQMLFLLTAIALIVGIPFLIIKRFSLSPHQEKPNTFCFVYYSLVFWLRRVIQLLDQGTVFPIIYCF